jgi:zinc protease
MNARPNPLAMPFERARIGAMDALLAPRPGSGLVAAALLSRRGSADEGAGEHGVAYFTSTMLPRGTRRRDSRQLAYDLESLGALADENCGFDGASLGLRVAAPESEAALRLFFEIVAEPAFDPREHEIQRQELLAGLRMLEDDKFSLTWRECQKALFAGHGYGHSVEGEVADAQAIAPDACRRWHAEAWRPQACLMVVVGDFEPGRMRALLENLTAGWGAAAAGAVPTRPRLATPTQSGPTSRGELGQTLSLARPGLTQGFVVVGYRAPALADPDYPALRLASAALGEGFGGRLFTRLRDQRSLAYACGSALRPHRLGSHQMFYIGTKPETIDEARDGLLAEAEALRREGIAEDELERARQHVIGKYLMGLQSHGQRAGNLAFWEDMAGDAKAGAAWPDRLRAVTADEARQAAERWWTRPTLAILRPAKESNAVSAPG